MSTCEYVNVCVCVFVSGSDILIVHLPSIKYLPEMVWFLLCSSQKRTSVYLVRH